MGRALSARPDGFTDVAPVPTMASMLVLNATTSLKQGARQKQQRCAGNSSSCWCMALGGELVNERLILAQALHTHFPNTTSREEISEAPNLVKVF